MLKTGDRTTDRQTHRGEYRVGSATKNDRDKAEAL